MVVGEIGNGWNQVTSELAYERSGPERWLSTYRVLTTLIDAVGPAPGPKEAEAIGRLVAHLWTLRNMSTSVAGMLQGGTTPNLAAAIVKDLGTQFEQEIPEVARKLVAAGRAQRRFRRRARPRHLVVAGLHDARRHARDPARHHRQGIGLAMSEMRPVLAATAARIFAAHDAPADGAWPASLWQALETAGLTLASVAEDKGGAGADLGDIMAILRAAGAQAAPVPLAETLLAAWLLSESGLGGAAGAAHPRADAARGRAETGPRRTPAGACRDGARNLPWAPGLPGARRAGARRRRRCSALRCVKRGAGRTHPRRTASPASRATMADFAVTLGAEQVGAGRRRHRSRRAVAARRAGADRGDGGRARNGARPDSALCRRARAVRPRHRQIPGGAAAARRARRQRRGRGRRRRRSHCRRGDGRRRLRHRRRQGAHRRGGGRLPPRSRTRSTARWASRANTRSIASPRGCGRGARSSATRAIGGPGSAATPRELGGQRPVAVSRRRVGRTEAQR